MWRYFFLLREFVRRDFDSRYAGSILGFIWSLLQPAWQLLLFHFVFAAVLKIGLVGERTENFAIFMFCGLLPWTAIHEGIFRGAAAITDNGSLVKKIHFPSEILVFTVVLAAVLHQLIAGALFVAVLAVVGELSVVTLPWVIVALGFQIALTTGLGLLAATVNTFFRDVGQLLTMGLTGWFYFTPIIYPLDMVPSRYQPYIEINPLTSLVNLYRHAFLGGKLPTLYDLAPLIVLSAAVLPTGLWVFRRMKPHFADEL